MHKVYELSGVSLAAAQRLARLSYIYFQKNPPLASGNLADMQQSYNMAASKLYEILDNHSPDLLEKCGLKRPSLTVHDNHKMLPRAYMEYPSIFPLTMNNQTKYYMYVPTSYNGEDFVPESARLLDDAEQRKTGYILFGGGWGGTAALLDIKRSGAKLPSDYKSKHAYKPHAGFDYLLTGRALDQLKAFQKAKREADERFKSLIDHVDQTIEKIIKAAGYEYETGRLSIIFSRSKLAEDNDVSGMEINLPGQHKMWDNDYFTVQPHPTTNSQMIHFRYDTAEGKSFQRYFNNLNEPTLQDFLETGGIGVIVFSGAGHHIIHSQTRLLDACSSIKPIPAGLAQWIKDDMSDLATGIQPPEMPQAYRDILASFDKQVPARALKGRQNHFKP